MQVLPCEYFTIKMDRMSAYKLFNLQKLIKHFSTMFPMWTLCYTGVYCLQGRICYFRPIKFIDNFAVVCDYLSESVTSAMADDITSNTGNFMFLPFYFTSWLLSLN